MNFSPPVVDVGRWRLAEPTDIDALLRVELDAQPAPWNRAVFERELTVDFSTIWIIEVDGIVQGVLVFWVVHDEVHILNVAIHTDARRRGIANSVLASLCEQAAQNRASVITLEVRASNYAAQTLYSRLGFECIAIRSGYYADNGEDAWVLTKVLDDPEDH